MRILVISTLSDLKDGLLPSLREAGHELVVVVPSIKKARQRRDLAGFALFEELAADVREHGEGQYVFF